MVFVRDGDGDGEVMAEPAFSFGGVRAEGRVCVTSICECTNDLDRLREE